MEKPKKYELGSLKVPDMPDRRDSSDDEQNNPAEESVEQRLGRASDYLDDYENEKKEGFGLSDPKNKP